MLVSTEETRKRGREGSDGYQAVGFTYSDSRRVEKSSLTGGPHILPPRLEHPPTSTVDIAENETDRFVIPAGLVIPTDIAQVNSLQDKYRTPWHVYIHLYTHTYYYIYIHVLNV